MYLVTIRNNKKINIIRNRSLSGDCKVTEEYFSFTFCLVMSQENKMKYINVKITEDGQNFIPSG